MAARYPPAPPPDPWKERFEAEARHHTRIPFPPGRKGAAVVERLKKPKGLAKEVPAGEWKYVGRRK